MNTECNASQLEFQGLGRRRVVGAFDGGPITSDGGALLLRETDLRFGITERLADCFTDYRNPDSIEHSVLELLRQRIFGIAHGYEDLNDHDDLMRDLLLAVAVGKEDVEGATRHRAGDKGKALASSSTLNRLELTPADATGDARYKKIVYHPERIRALLVDLFLASFDEEPAELVIDFDATDIPIHGAQEGRFFHGYYRNHCYLPLYATCGNHLLTATLRTADRDASIGTTEELAYLVGRIRQRFPDVKLFVRADSGFARDALMHWCEENGVYYVLGLAKNVRLIRAIGTQRYEAQQAFEHTGQAARVFTELRYRTKDSWSCTRRVIAKAEHLARGANPRFIVTNVPGSEMPSRPLYEEFYCARGDMENRIKEQQLDLYADRTSTATMRANQLRLWFSAISYTLMNAMRNVALKGTRLAKATCGTIRLKLLKIGAQIKRSVRRFSIHFASACPYQDVFIQAWHNLQHYPLRI